MKRSIFFILTIVFSFFLLQGLTFPKLRIRKNIVTRGTGASIKTRFPAVEKKIDKLEYEELFEVNAPYKGRRKIMIHFEIPAQTQRLISISIISPSKKNIAVKLNGEVVVDGINYAEIKEKEYVNGTTILNSLKILNEYDKNKEGYIYLQAIATKKFSSKRQTPKIVIKWKTIQIKY